MSMNFRNSEMRKKRILEMDFRVLESEEETKNQIINKKSVNIVLACKSNEECVARIVWVP